MLLYVALQGAWYCWCGDSRHAVDCCGRWDETLEIAALYSDRRIFLTLIGFGALFMDFVIFGLFVALTYFLRGFAVILV